MHSQTHIKLAIQRYRTENPASRAVDSFVNKGGGSQRKYVCTFCRCLIDTESASYRRTVHAKKAIVEHANSCQEIGKLVRRAKLNP